MKSVGKIFSFATFALLVSLTLTSCSSGNSEENKQLAISACSNIDDVYNSKPDFSATHEEIAATFSEGAARAKYELAAKSFLELSKSDESHREEFERYAAVLSKPDPRDPSERFTRTEELNSSRLSEAWTFCGGWGGYGGIGDIRPEKYSDSTLSTYALGEKVIDYSDSNSGESTDWTPLILIGIVALYILAAYWIARTARNAGRSFAGWFLLGIVIPPIAGIIVLTFKPEKDLSALHKKCPYCAETIQVEAKLCRFCSKEIS